MTGELDKFEYERRLKELYLFILGKISLCSGSNQSFSTQTVVIEKMDLFSSQERGNRARREGH